jgi:hypothetical protein
MQQWKNDLESLLEETKALIRKTNPKSLDAVARLEAPLPQQQPPPTSQQQPPPTSPQQLPPASRQQPQPASRQPQPPQPVSRTSPPETTKQSPAREEIKQRVAGFRAHQEKLRREREDYYLETTAKTRAMLRGMRDED